MASLSDVNESRYLEGFVKFNYGSVKYVYHLKHFKFNKNAIQPQRKEAKSLKTELEIKN